MSGLNGDTPIPGDPVVASTNSTTPWWSASNYLELPVGGGLMAIAAMASILYLVYFTFLGTLLLHPKNMIKSMMASLIGVGGFIMAFMFIVVGREFFQGDNGFDFVAADDFGMMMFALAIFPLVVLTFIAAGKPALISTIVMGVVASLFIMLIRLPGGYGGFLLAGLLFFAGMGTFILEVILGMTL